MLAKDLATLYQSVPARRRGSKFYRGPLCGTTVRMPVAYLQILDHEAALLEGSRTHALSVMLKHWRGELGFARAEGAPTCDVTEPELRLRTVAGFTLPLEGRLEFDEERLAMGNMSPMAFIVMLINHWLGKPKGLRG